MSQSAPAADDRGVIERKTERNVGKGASDSSTRLQPTGRPLE